MDDRPTRIMHTIIRKGRFACGTLRWWGALLVGRFAGGRAPPDLFGVSKLVKTSHSFFLFFLISSLFLGKSWIYLKVYADCKDEGFELIFWKRFIKYYLVLILCLKRT